MLASRSRSAGRRRRRCTTRRSTSLSRAYLCESRRTSVERSLRSSRPPSEMPKLGDTASGSAREMSLSTRARRVACSHGWTYSGPRGSDQPSLNGNGAEKALTHGRAAGTIERIDVSDARRNLHQRARVRRLGERARGVERVRQLAVERSTVVVVAVAPEVRFRGARHRAAQSSRPSTRVRVRSRKVVSTNWYTGYPSKSGCSGPSLGNAHRP